MSPPRPLRTLLVPHDFSAHADAALAFALVLAKGTGARIALLHAYELPLQQVSPAGMELLEQLLCEVRAQARARLEEVAARVRAAGVAVETELREGDPSPLVVALAGELPADLVVMGTRGRTGIRKALVGSVARHVVTHAPCPVVTVRCDAD